MQAILRAQGFENQLDQYSVKHIIGEGSCNPVWLAQHRISGLSVAIKAIETVKYKRLTLENQISEGYAMNLCQSSLHVVNFIEEFTLDDKTYIVTKFVRGGDLLSYLSNLGVDKVPEDHAHYIFR